MKQKKSLAIIGGGASALMLAAQLDESKFDVIIYERNAACGRKLLVAGAGGFNLTHSELPENFSTRYSLAPFIEKSFSVFNNTDLRNWLKDIGIPTYIGTSKRVFPEKGIKPIDVLNKILDVLKRKNVSIKTNHHWKGWSENDEHLFQHLENTILIKPDITVFALGGGSWKVTGSDGSCLSSFERKGIKTIPFEPSNAACKINWKKEFIESAEGKSLKNILLKINGKEQKGELIITEFGIEGGAIYALNNAVRKELKTAGHATVLLDLKPVFTLNEIKTRIIPRGNKSVSKQLEDELNFGEVQILLLKTLLSKQEFTDIDLLAEKIKNLPLAVVGLAPIDEAISTVGGVSNDEMDEEFQLNKLPNTYCIGEMLDWDAPTGGYLLQACFSMGYYLAKRLNV